MQNSMRSKRFGNSELACCATDVLHSPLSLKRPTLKGGGRQMSPTRSFVTEQLSGNAGSNSLNALAVVLNFNRLAIRAAVRNHPEFAGRDLFL
jgi:hypothetical protein